MAKKRTTLEYSVSYYKIIKLFILVSVLMFGLVIVFWSPLNRSIINDSFTSPLKWLVVPAPALFIFFGILIGGSPEMARRLSIVFALSFALFVAGLAASETHLYTGPVFCSFCFAYGVFTLNCLGFYVKNRFIPSKKDKTLFEKLFSVGLPIAASIILYVYENDLLSEKKLLGTWLACVFLTVGYLSTYTVAALINEEMTSSPNASPNYPWYLTFLMVFSLCWLFFPCLYLVGSGQLFAGV